MRSPLKIRERSMVIANFVSMGISTYRARVLVQASFLIAAVVMGIVAAYFNELITYMQRIYDGLFQAQPYVMAANAPMGFVPAAGVAKWFAPHAGGSGVPQVLYAASLNDQENKNVVSSGLLSLRTAVVKVISTCIGFLVGASVGGEGPTIQIAAAIFANIGNVARRYFPNIDFRSYLVAASGAGVAAAFNTPLGGVVFALEEVALDSFGGLRHTVMLAVVVAGLTSRGLVGNELYFGHFTIGRTDFSLLYWAAVVGISGGILGGLFGRIIASQRLYNLRINWWQRALFCGVIVSAIGLSLHGATSGSGYHVTRAFMEGNGASDQPLYFPLAKLVATAFSTLSGMGGGILAPAVSIGGWMGISIAKVATLYDPKIFALLGMAAFFSAAFQVPMTAVIVVMEMSNEHDVIIPMMIASLTSFSVVKLIMPVSLYHLLIERSFHKKTLSD